MNDRNPPVRDTSDDDDDRFLGDPLLPAFYREEQDTYFSLGLVVNWATTSTTTCSTILSSQQSYNATNYERFVSAVKAECFCGRNNNDDPDIPFFLPFHALHITVASLFQACKLSQLPPSRRQHAEEEPTIVADAAGGAGAVTTKQKRHTDNTTTNFTSDDSVVDATGDDDDDDDDEGDQRRLALATKWKQVVRRATASEHWPKRPLELELDTAQIRSRAGIFLWKEHTGGIAQMRRCLEIAAKQKGEDELFTSTLKIPDIVHTTFVRYHHNNHNHQHNRDEAGTEKYSDTTTTGNGNDNDNSSDNSSDEATVLRPSQAHSILIERVVPNQALFTKTTTSNSDDDDDDDDASNGANIERVVAVDVASLVDCKIYLLDPGKEKDHEVFLSLPLVQDSTKA